MHVIRSTVNGFLSPSVFRSNKETCNFSLPNITEMRSRQSIRVYVAFRNERESASDGNTPQM